MFKVIAGMPLDDNAKWFRGKISDSYAIAVEAEWFEDKIVRDELKRSLSYKRRWSGNPATVVESG